ncbi:ABC-2 transporter permease [Aerococcus sp. UMB1112A]|uniref:ABC-2 transporter permease n=1 Tax=Aerococcus sp. UMB1112A TaxID=3050609 RepID=UPI00254B773A|nr:ABC-2 transporter permease [Aerococcus sp. UMB1112A]MDK8503200.1 ABC-2 transporter permease [Aerococcus sp. UMB1112A]
MKALLVKDWLIGRKLLFLSLAVSLLVLFIVGDGQFPLTLGLMLALFNIRNMDGLDDKRTYRQLIQTLPVSRREVVAGKILSHLLQVATLILPLIILNAMIPGYRANSLTEILLLGLLAVFLLVGYQFTYTLFGPVFMNYISIALFILLITFGWTIFNSAFVQGLISYLQSLDPPLLVLSASLVCLILASALFILTVKIYERKDL